MQLSHLKIALSVAVMSVMLSGQSVSAEKKMPSPEIMRKTETALAAFARELSVTQVQPRTVHTLLIDFLKKNPHIYGAAFAFAPAEQGGKPIKVSPYVYRRKGQLVVKELVQVGGDYTKADWYAVPAASKQPYWSKPYFDTEGGKINMITYSIPVYFNGQNQAFMGVVTSDLPVN